MKATAAALLTLVAAIAAPAVAQRSIHLDPEGVREYWTPQRVLSARAMPMPAINLEHIRETQEFEAISSRGRSFDWAPAAPTAGVVPDFNRRLFREGLKPPRRSSRSSIRVFEQPGAEFVAINRGTFQLDFSSSRVVPEAARLAYPYSTVGKLFMTFGGQRFVCSAAVISARLVLTAGHCLFDGAFATNVMFVPAYYQGEEPFGSWEAEALFVTESWASTEDVPNVADFGVVVVADQDFATARSGNVIQKIGQVTGWLGFKTGSLDDNHVHILGYPQSFDRGEQMHQVTTGDANTGAASPAVLYGGDMRGGASGGPWVQNFGVTARGQRGGKNKTPNRVVGVSSFTSTDNKLRVIGSSVFNSNAKAVFDDACADTSGNCSKKGKPNKQ